MTAPVVRTGVDIQSIERFRAHEPPVAAAIRERVFTDAERAYCERTGDPDQHYAARFAAKEAFCKLLDAPVSLAAVSVERPDSRPELALSAAAAEGLSAALGTERWTVDLSLSHDRTADAAAAVVVAVGEP